MPVLQEVNFEVTDELADLYARSVVERVLLARGGFLSRPAYLIVPVLLLLPLTALGWLSLGTFLLLAGLAGGLALLTLLRRSACCQQARDAVLAPFEGEPQRQMRVVLGEEGITMDAAALHSTAQWHDLGEVVLWPDFWLLRLRAGGQFVLPATAVTPDVASLIRGQATAAGVEVREEVH